MSSCLLANGGLWIAWLVYWVLAARRSAPGRSAEPRWSRLLHLGAVVLALALLVRSPFHVALPGGRATCAIGDLLTGLGLALAVQARAALGRQWSGRVEVKEEKRLVRSGPYRWVRHPIYSGVLLAIAGSAVATRQVSALLAVVVMLAAYLRKIRREEVVLREAFGSAYDAYRREVRALVPFVL
jgi:protein-S-isoprenylcysteine O-methyltransferase Ste14